MLASFITDSAVFRASRPRSFPNEEIKISLILSKETLFEFEIIFEIFNLPKSKLASEIVGTIPPFP